MRLKFLLKKYIQNYNVLYLNKVKPALLSAVTSDEEGGRKIFQVTQTENKPTLAQNIFK